MPIINVQVGHNDGSVICSDYNTDWNYNINECVKSDWKFTTLKSPVDDDHPVSGNREFGYVKNDNGSYTFYTRGVDRVQDGLILNGTAADIAFSKSDALWGSFQKRVQDFVNSHSGRAQAQASKNVRPDWTTVKEILDRKGKKTMKDLVCKQS